MRQFSEIERLEREVRGRANWLGWQGQFCSSEQWHARHGQYLDASERLQRMQGADRRA